MRIFVTGAGGFVGSNPYGFRKAASELVVTQCAARGTVARMAGVQGIHRAQRHAPRRQDAGFGYLEHDLDGALARLREEMDSVLSPV